MKAFVLAILAAAVTASAPRRGYQAPAKKTHGGYNSFGGHAASSTSFGGYGYGAPAKKAPAKKSARKGHRSGYGSRSSLSKPSFGGFKGGFKGLSIGKGKNVHGKSRKGGYGGSKRHGGYRAPQKFSFHDHNSYNASPSYSAFDDHQDDHAPAYDRWGAKGNPALFSTADMFGNNNFSLGPVTQNSYNFSLDNVGYSTPDFGSFN